MGTDADESGFEPAYQHSAERARLVRFCSRLTGDRDVAEDLAQETLVVAWCQERELRDPARRDQWLLGIARNLCLTWIRGRARESARLVQPARAGDAPLPTETDVPDAVDLEVELERHELVNLLDRALALLPSDTRDVPVDRFVRESPHAEIAARLGPTENAVAKRIERGKLVLKGILTTRLRDEAAAYGLVDPAKDTWQETRIWCPTCGERRLVGRFAPGRDLQLDCLGCLGHPRSVAVRGRTAELLWGGITLQEVLVGIKGFKPALNRLLSRIDSFYQHGIAGRTARCPRCRQAAPLRVSSYDVDGFHDVQTICAHCGAASGIGTVVAVATARPEGRAFWREQRRMRILPERAIEVGGVPALVARLASPTGNASLDVVFARDTLEVIAVHGAR